MDSLLTSRDVMAQTGISRATLNNYVSQGILPRPEVAPGADASRVRRIGYFPPDAVAIIRRVAALKSDGFSMAEIIKMMRAQRQATRAHTADGAVAPLPSITKDSQSEYASPLRAVQTATPPGMDLRLTLDRIEAPAYLVNPRFEVEWANEEAQTLLFGECARWPAEIAERKFFNMLLEGDLHADAAGGDCLKQFHLSIAKRRLSKASLMDLEIFNGDPADADELSIMFGDVEVTEGFGPMHTQIDLAPRGALPKLYDVHASFFREGVFFAYSPIAKGQDELIHFLARRDVVIRDLLQRRKPYLTDVAVLVADLQSSTMICAELPPEEYFELINDVWTTMSPLLRKYFATHGKHVGDGLVCYFFPQPDSDYVMNAVKCALEMKDAMTEVSRRWKNRKNWFNNLVLNVGLHEGQEWFGAYQTPTHVEFTVLGDTINMAARLSDLGRDGAILASKNMFGKVPSRDRDRLRYGVHRTDVQGFKILIPETYARVSGLIDLADPRHAKFNDISNMAVAEILDLTD